MRARDNPFRTERVLTVRYRFVTSLDWSSLLHRLERLDHRAAIVGPHGSGKTTLQEDLAARVQSQGRPVRWLKLNRENRHRTAQLMEALFKAARTDDLLFVDGAEQLGLLRWQRFRRRAADFAGLVITVHVTGRLATLIECHTDPRLLHQIVASLTPPDARPPRQLLDELYHCHNGNLRLCLRDLYDLWSSLHADEPITANPPNHRTRS